MQIINKINSLPISPVPENVTDVDKDKPSSKSQKVNRKTGSSTMDFLGVLSGTDCQVLDTPVNLQLQLFSSSPENDSPPKLASSRKYFSSDSSNPTEEHSPSFNRSVRT
ncbi:hypothetical protein Hanom_Chr05g00428411 [Helianthus anomalus]